jgi:phosphinothricin acetyltransferase
MIRPANARDAEAIATIYNHYIVHTPVTFETEPVSAAEMAARIHEIVQASLPWLVIEDQGVIAGYAYASKWKGRCAYRYSAETTVYLDAGTCGRGLGKRLYEALIAELQRLGFHVAIGGIALPNEASVALHETLGFEAVARFREVGFKFEQWLDVGYWQRLL